MTPLSNFSYFHTPLKSFMLQVERVETADAVFLMAGPWKAIADYIYVKNKRWVSLEDMMKDLRVEADSIEEADIADLATLCVEYASEKVRSVLKKIHKDLINAN